MVFAGGDAASPGLHAVGTVSLGIAVSARRREQELPAGEAFTPHQRTLVATIVHNAGIYNGILAAGLAWAALTGESAHDVARVLLAGAAAAGIFGTVTMRSAPTVVQAFLGIIGLLII